MVNGFLEKNQSWYDQKKIGVPKIVEKHLRDDNAKEEDKMENTKCIILPDNVSISDISDGYHTFRELYNFRKVYNAVLFNEWARQGKYQIHKSLRHDDGETCFNSNDYFIVVAMLPTGQITNHYKIADWDLFDVPETVTALFPFDGHTPNDVLIRLTKLIQNKG